jgi:restriction system protein
MPIPSYDQFIEPLLRYLAEQKEPVRAKQVYDAVADRVGLTAEDKAELLPSKIQLVYHNRIGWAHDRLKRARYSEAPRRGYWMLTAAGRDFVTSTPRLTTAQLEAIMAVAADSSASPDDGAAGEKASPPAAADQSPREKIDSGLQALRSSVAQDILEVIARSEPEFFERLVLDVLHKMGYGTSRKDLQHVGRSGDGGIDGIISLDRLGLEKVYVQAKKWQNQVGSPQIQGFMGALQLQGASKGVLITSGAISGPARDAAKQARGTVVLIDGNRLAQLMIEHDVGVSNEVVKVPKIDMDYFEDE